MRAYDGNRWSARVCQRGEATRTVETVSMNWQKSIRAIFVMAATAQLASLFVLYDTKGIADRRETAQARANEIMDGYLQRDSLQLLLNVPR